MRSEVTAVMRGSENAPFIMQECIKGFLDILPAELWLLILIWSHVFRGMIKVAVLHTSLFSDAYLPRRVGIPFLLTKMILSFVQSLDNHRHIALRLQ